MSGDVQLRWPEFLSRDHQRSNVESASSVLKVTIRDGVRSRMDAAMTNEVLLTLPCHNIGVVHRAIIERGVEA